MGISGVDASGKTEFAKGFVNYLRKKNTVTQPILIDDFHNEKKIRYKNIDRVKCYFQDSFNISKIVDELLVPIAEGKTVNVSFKLLNLEADQYTIGKSYSATKDTIVVFEGVFLFRDEFSDYIDYKVWVDADSAECLRRAKLRDSKSAYAKYETKYLPAQKHYLSKYPPNKIADLIIDNITWENPIIIPQTRYC